MGAACCSEIAKAETFAAPAYQGKSANPHAAVPSGAVPPGGHALATGPAAAAIADGGNAVNPEVFISQVAELPKFDKKQRSRGGDEVGSSSSVGSSRAADVDGLSEVVDEVASKEQRQQAKSVVKDFVKEMVKGKKMSVMTQTGQLKTCSASLNRSLDTFSIKVGTQKRSIPLKDIEEIHAGAEDIEGVTTPLDELCATLMLKSDDCITFRLNDINARDTFVMCLLMFCNHQK